MPRYMVGFREGTSQEEIDNELKAWKAQGLTVHNDDGGDLKTVDMPESLHQNMLATKSATSKIEFIGKCHFFIQFETVH